MWVERPITERDFLRLEEHMKSEAYQNSKTWAGKSNYEVRSGLLGQIKAADLFGVDPFAYNTRDYDLIRRDERVDVKTTALGVIKPRMEWLAKVPEDDEDKWAVDTYVFCTININLKLWWGMGKILRRKFFSPPTKYYAVGSLMDPENPNSVAKAAFWGRPYEELDPLL